MLPGSSFNSRRDALIVSRGSPAHKLQKGDDSLRSLAGETTAQWRSAINERGQSGKGQRTPDRCPCVGNAPVCSSEGWRCHVGQPMRAGRVAAPLGVAIARRKLAGDLPVNMAAPEARLVAFKSSAITLPHPTFSPPLSAIARLDANLSLSASVRTRSQ